MGLDVSAGQVALVDEQSVLTGDGADQELLRHASSEQAETGQQHSPEASANSAGTSTRPASQPQRTPARDCARPAASS
eukprot:768672-Hanusia_phi.AAC.13